MKKGPHAKKQWIPHAGIPVHFSVPRCPDGIKCLATFRETLHPVSPEFGKQKPVPTHWVSWPAEERKLEGDWEMAMAEKPAAVIQK